MGRDGPGTILTMNTTNLFVELIVIGVGAIIWITLLAISFLGIGWLDPSLALSGMAVIPGLAIIYVLGIVFDRLSDFVFGLLSGNRALKREFPNPEVAHQARRRIMLWSDRMADTLEYGRSRIRICRGWTLHSFLIAGSLVWLAWRRFNFGEPAFFGFLGLAGGCVLLGLACGLSWRHLNRSQYLRQREMAELVEKELERGYLPRRERTDF